MKKNILLLILIIVVIVLLSATIFLIVTNIGTTTDKSLLADTKQANNALTPKPLSTKNIPQNPYMANSENCVHVDNYNSDTTDSILPIGINSEVISSFDTESTNAPPSVLYDSYNNTYAPYLSTGIAARNIDSTTIYTQGSFVPSIDDDHQYAIQQSYSFIDNNNNIVAPTTDNRIIILKTLDDDGKVLEKFDKILDINIGKIIESKTGKVFDQSLMSIVYDYEGNLWFTTGGFKIFPSREESGYIGYISRKAIEDTLNNININLENEIHIYETQLGEGAENGIASSPYGAVILTNMACYLLNATNEGVNINWRVPYENINISSTEEQSSGGLSYGSGTSPALSNEYVFFADKMSISTLYCIELSTGKIVDTLPVLDNLPNNAPVSIDNAAIAYENNSGDVGIILCNWYGASNPSLSDPNSDSSIQSYDNLYNPEWIQSGNIEIMPGIERADLKEIDGNKELVSVWCRDDIRSTAMFKLSTATGYLYGYAQDIDSKMWQYLILDYETGETVYTYDVSSLNQYNNMAVGIYSNPTNNALYCPTNNYELLRLQDRFAYLTQSPYREIEIDNMGREVITTETFNSSKGTGTPVSWQHNVTVYNSTDTQGYVQLTLLINGLEGNTKDLKLYAKDINNEYELIPQEYWSIDTSDEILNKDTVYNVTFKVLENSTVNLIDKEDFVKLSVLLAK